MTKKYFNFLNYTLANEDTSLEVELVKTLLPKKIVSIAGSGGRSLPLLASLPEELICIDYSPHQLSLTRLREEAIKKLTYDDYLLFLGYPPNEGRGSILKRQEVFHKLQLLPEDKSLFENIFQELEGDTFLYQGKWESTFRKLSVLVRWLMGEKVLRKCCSFNDQKSQIGFFATHFSHLKWSIILRVLGNAAVFNALLYKGDFVQKNIELSHFDYYKQAFNRIFNKTLLKDNFFIQLCFFGKIIDSAAIPIEGSRNIFDKMQQWLISGRKIKYYQGDVVEIFENNAEINQVDFFSFSNVPSYFKGARESDFLKIIAPKLSSGAHVVIRNYLRLPENLNISDFEDVTAHFQPLIDKEKTQMYMVKIYRKR